MINFIWYIIGLFLYTFFEGITEGITWNMAQTRLDVGKYHLYRLLEILGIGFMISASHFYTNSNLIFLIVRLIGSVFFGFLMFRIAFVITREQSSLVPTWHYVLFIPLINKTLRIKYPSQTIVIIFGIIGLLLIIFSF